MKTAVKISWKRGWLMAALIFLSLFGLRAQNNSVSIGSETIKPSAVLWLNGDGSQGLILPVVTNVTGIATPESGMIVFQSSDNSLQLYNGSAWSAVGSGGGSDSQTLTISGNTLTISNGNSVNISGSNPTTAGQLYSWDGSQWSTTSATAPTNGQVLSWNGSNWEPITPSGTGTPYTAGTGINIDGANVISNTGDTDASDDITNATTLGGDLNGTLPNPTINALQGTSLSITAPINGQVLKYNGSAWVAGTDDIGGGSVATLNDGQLLIGDGVSNSAGTVTGDLSLTGSSFTITNDAVTSAKIFDGTITGADIASTTVTNANISDLAPSKLLQEGAILGQVLRWNGTTWVPATPATVLDSDDQTLTYVAATNILSIESGNTVDLSDLQQSLSLVAAGTNRTIDITDGAGIILDVADNDNDSANELQSLSLAGTDITLSNGGGTVSINDADSDATNELNTGIAIVGNEVQVTDAGGTLSGTLTSIAPSNGQILKWNGTEWAPAADDVGAGGLPSLTDAQIVTNDGASNIPVDVQGDLSMDNTGSFTVNSLQGTNLNVVTPALNEVLKWDGSQWVAGTDDVGGGGLPTINNAQLLTNNGASNIAVTVSGDITFANDGTVTINNDAVNSAKIADGSITDIDIADVDAGKVTGLGALALLSSVSSTEITDGAVTTDDIANGTIANIDIANVAPDKITQSGATTGEVLKWDGVQWSPAADTGGSTVTLTNAQLITNDGVSDVAVTVSGDVTFANDGTVTVVSGAITSAKILDGTIQDIDINDVDASKVTGLGVIALLNTITSADITDGTITGADINQLGAASGEALVWNGTTWAPAAVTDGDGDATNELNTVFQVNAGNLEITDAGGTLTVPLTSLGDGVDDADNDPLNEVNTGFQVNAGNLEITDSNGTLSVPLTSISTDDQTAIEVPYDNLSSGLAATDVQAALDEIDLAVDNLPTLLDDLTDASVTSANFGEILVGDGAVYRNVFTSGDVIMDGDGINTIQTTAGDNIIDAINDAGTTGLISETRIAGLGVGTRAILGSNNSGIASWVTGGTNELLGTDAGGNLAFYPNAPFFNGTGTSGYISRWDGTGTAFADANLRDDNVDITVENGLGLKFGLGSRINAIRSDADGGVRAVGTADDQTAVTELAVRSAIDGSFDQTNLSDNFIPYALGGTFGESSIRNDGTTTFFDGIIEIEPFVPLRFFDDDRSNFVEIIANTDILNDYVLVLPNDVPAVDGQVLSSDISGNLSWATPSGISADNGLNVNGADIELGGILNTPTNIDLNGIPLTFSTPDIGVGIGTPGLVPESFLHVQTFNGSGLPTMILGHGNQPTREFELSVNALGNMTLTNEGNGSPVEVMNFTNTGNVGIGTASPASVKLEIFKNSADTDPFIYLNQQGTGNSAVIYEAVGQRYIAGIDGTTGTFKINRGSDVSAVPDFQIDGTGNINLGIAGVFAAGGNLRIDAGGDIYSIKGVGYDWPSVNSAGVLTNDGVGILSWSPALTSASNGLTLTGTDVRLGGTLTGPTTIDGNTNTLTFTDINASMGNGNTVTNGSFAIGDDNNLSSFVGISIGTGNTITGNRGIAIGNYVESNHLGSIVMGDWSGSSPGLTASSTGDQFTSRFNNGYRFYTTSDPIANPENGVFIDGDGDLGVGDINPNAKLHVNAGGTPEVIRIEGNQPYISFYDGATYEQFIQSFNDDLYLGSQVGDIVLANNTGIGGETNPVNTLDVDGTAVIGSGYSGTFTAPANGLLVEGSVGIGTETLTDKVNIQGGDLTIGDGFPWLNLRKTATNNAGIDFEENNSSGQVVTRLIHLGSNDRFEIQNDDATTYFSSAGGVGILANPDTQNGGSGINHNASLTITSHAQSDAYAFKIFRSDYTASWYQGIASASGNLIIGFNGNFRGQFDDASGNYTPSSDRRLKKNIGDLYPVLKNTMKLRPRTYHFKTQDNSEMNEIGLISQEVKDLFPELVDTNGQDGFFTMNYSVLSVVAIKAIQEQQQIIDKQQAEIESLKKQLNSVADNDDKVAENTSELETLRAELEAIKAMLTKSEISKEQK